MNERIRELMTQAVTFYLDPDSNAYEAQVSPEDMELFAELIVRECAKVSERTGALNEADFEGEMIADAIKEHFGIE